MNQEPTGTVGGGRCMDRFVWLTFILMLGSASCAAAAEKEPASASKEPAQTPFYKSTYRVIDVHGHAPLASEAAVLEKFYHANAERLIPGLAPPISGPIPGRD